MAFKAIWGTFLTFEGRLLVSEQIFIFEEEKKNDKTAKNKGSESTQLSSSSIQTSIVTKNKSFSTTIKNQNFTQKTQSSNLALGQFVELIQS